MATLNAAECFRLFDRGGFAPGLRADIVLAEDLKHFKAKRVYIRGKLVAENGICLPSDRFPLSQNVSDDRSVRSSFHVEEFSAKKLALPLNSDYAWIIDIKGGSIITGKERALVKRDSSGLFVHEPGSDIVKIAVVERHRGTGNVGVGLIRGYGINSGAVAISVAHDSHNIITVGVSDTDMCAAVERLIAIGGGAVLFRNGSVLEEMPLPLGGIMSDQSGKWVDQKLKSLEKKAIEELGVSRAVDPLMTLCFMALPVIPELKITDMGLFDVEAFTLIPVEAE
jgi:adenine deaminase